MSESKQAQIVVWGRGSAGWNSAMLPFAGRANHAGGPHEPSSLSAAALPGGHGGVVRDGHRAADPLDPVEPPNITVLLDKVVDFKLAEKKVVLADKVLTYDYLVLALGGCTSYFGHPEWEQFAPGLNHWRTRSGFGTGFCWRLKKRKRKPRSIGMTG